MATAADIGREVADRFRKLQTPPIHAFKATGDPTKDAKLINRYLERFEYLCKAMHITTPEAKKTALSMVCGDFLSEVDTSIADKNDDGDEYEKIRKKFLRRFNALDIELISRTDFRLIMQKPGQSFYAYYTELKTEAKYCKFGDNENNNILQQMLVGTNNDKIRKEFYLKVPKTAEEFLESGNAIDRSNDLTKHQKEQQSTRSGNVNKLSYRRHPQAPKNQKCGYCGGAQQHSSRDQCPAFNKDCRKCSRRGHFASVCRSGKGKPMQSKSNSFQKRKFQKRKFTKKIDQGEADEIEVEDQTESGLVSQIHSQLLL